MLRRLTMFLTLAAVPAMAQNAASRPEEPSTVTEIADRIVMIQVVLDPVLAYLYDLPVTTHDSFAARSPGSLAAMRDEFDVLRSKLDRVEPAGLSAHDASTFAIAKEFLNAERGLRVCRNELWAVDHMLGWQRFLPILAARQPVSTIEEKEQALERWRSFPAWIDGEIANLRQGLAEGYSAPQSVVVKVIVQIEGMIQHEVSRSPIHSPAARSEDDDFVRAYEDNIRSAVNPALQRYRNFLQTEYLPQARTQLPVSANPHGRECYAASLRKHTTLRDTPEEIMRRGESAVARNLSEIAALTGGAKDGIDVVSILGELRLSPANRIGSEDEVAAATRMLVEKGRLASTQVFESLPLQPLEVVLYPPHLRGSGVASHYEPGGGDGQSARFMLQTDNWQEQRRSDLEILAYHEAYPGHHLQQGLAQQSEQHPIARLAGNSAYVEGWGRYAEALAEELGLYESDLAKIQRRAWPARGMVADLGLHLMGWSREQTYRYLLATGRFSAADTDDLLDRMAVMPGQLTAYDTGALHILALRDEARSSLGQKFDLAEFHSVILRHGAVPLPWLSQLVDQWIAEQLAES